MGQDSVIVMVGENGRIKLPATQRKLVGLKSGGVAVIRVEDGEIRIRPVQAVIEEIQELARPYFEGSGESVDRFIAERYEEASRES